MTARLHRRIPASERWPDDPAPADEIESPEHYIAGRQIEPIDVIEDWNLPHHLACALKYVARCGRKGGPDSAITDLRKIEWYARRYRELLERRQGVEL